MTVFRDQQGHIGRILEDLTGLKPAEALNEDSFGRRMTNIEIEHRKLNLLLSDANDLMHDVLMEAKNGKDPFKPNKPSALERLTKKKEDVIRMMK